MFSNCCQQFANDKSAQQQGNNGFGLDGMKKHENSEAQKTANSRQLTKEFFSFHVHAQLHLIENAQVHMIKS